MVTQSEKHEIRNGCVSLKGILKAAYDSGRLFKKEWWAIAFQIERIEAATEQERGGNK